MKIDHVFWYLAARPTDVRSDTRVGTQSITHHLSTDVIDAARDAPEAHQALTVTVRTNLRGDLLAVDGPESDKGLNVLPQHSSSATSTRPQGLCQVLYESRMPIPPRRSIPDLTPWKPGTTGLYPRPLGAAPVHTSPRDFPIWTARIPGMRPQEAMFQAADKIDKAASAPSAFYVAADTWRHDQKNGWGLSKIYGAFRNVESFINQLLIPAPNRCFYEIIRANSACKAYFDLEVGGGVLNPEQGFALCQKVIAEWAVRVRARWPSAARECPRCLVPIILDGSRQTSKG